MSEEIKELIDQIKLLRRDMHWHHWGPTGKPIWDENGCCCDHFRKLGMEAWGCQLHGRVVRSEMENDGG